MISWTRCIKSSRLQRKFLSSSSSSSSISHFGGAIHWCKVFCQFAGIFEFLWIFLYTTIDRNCVKPACLIYCADTDTECNKVLYVRILFGCLGILLDALAKILWIQCIIFADNVALVARRLYFYFSDYRGDNTLLHWLGPSWSQTIECQLMIAEGYA